MAVPGTEVGACPAAGGSSPRPAGGVPDQDPAGRQQTADLHGGDPAVHGLAGPFDSEHFDREAVKAAPVTASASRGEGPKWGGGRGSNSPDMAAPPIGEAFCAAVKPLVAFGHGVPCRIPLLALVLVPSARSACGLGKASVCSSSVKPRWRGAGRRPVSQTASLALSTVPAHVVDDDRGHAPLSVVLVAIHVSGAAARSEPLRWLP